MFTKSFVERTSVERLLLLANLLTLGSILRGKALAPLKYKPVDSAVRENKEVEKMLENYSIKGGIKVKSSKV